MLQSSSGRPFKSVNQRVWSCPAKGAFVVHLQSTMAGSLFMLLQHIRVGSKFEVLRPCCAAQSAAMKNNFVALRAAANFCKVCTFRLQNKAFFSTVYNILASFSDLTNFVVAPRRPLD